MHSTLLHLGPLPLQAYGLMMALGFAAAWFAAGRLSRGTARHPDMLANLTVWLMLAGVAGARLAYVAEHWTSEFAARPLSVVRIDQGGLMFYGGVAGAALALLLFARRHHERPVVLMDLMAAVLPLGHAFGRIGCFLHGCCHGRVSDSALAVVFPAGSPAWDVQCTAGLIPVTASQSLPVLPTQLFESGANLLLFVALALVYRRQAALRPGLVTALYLMAYAVIRFTIEPLRGDLRMAVGAWSIGQTISLVLFACGLMLAVICLCRRPAPAGRAP